MQLYFLEKSVVICFRVMSNFTAAAITDMDVAFLYVLS